MDDQLPYQITFTHVHSGATDCEPMLLRTVEVTLSDQKIRRATINVALVDDDEIARLNKKHLHHDRPTDVLSFNLSTNPNPDSNPNRNVDPDRCVEGELVVSIETARREADRRQHSVEAELALYVAHGVLHLIGHDDATAQQANRMHEIEEQILVSVGLPAVFYGEDAVRSQTSEPAQESGINQPRNEHERSGQTGPARCRGNDPSAPRHGRE